MACVTIRCLHHLLIYVSDLERAATFYTRLGMEPIPSLGPRIRWMRMGPNELHLMANEGSWQRFREEPSPHFAIEADDIHAAQQLIPRIGGEILQEVGARPHDGSLYLFALDPDGNRFEVTQHSQDWHLRHALLEAMKGKGSLRSACVEGALRSVPRHLFLPNKPLQEAYSDQAILTKDQGEARSSCSQPSIVAIMLELLRLQGGENILEIGAGTGWNAALMSALSGSQGRVTTLEIDQDTAESARSNVAQVKAANVQVINSDGGFGWPESAPYDAIIATCGASDISPHWAEQLREGGVFVAPLWFNTTQFCGAWEKRGDKLFSRDLSWAGFMPLRGHFATARQIEENGASFLFDEMHALEMKALSLLLSTAAREVELPELYTNGAPANSSFLTYLALRGEPLLMLTPPGVLNAVSALSVEPESLLVLDMEPRLYGSQASVERLRARWSEWEASGRPGLEQAHLTVAERNTLQPEPDAFLVRKTWMDYLVRFQPPELKPPQ